MSRRRIAVAVAATLLALHLGSADAAPDIELGPAVEVTRLPDPYSHAIAPSLAVDASGRPHVTWWEWHAGAAYSVEYSGSSDDVGAFGAPTRLYASGYGSRVNPQVALAGESVTVMWDSAGKGNPGDVRLRRRAAGAAGWDAEVNVSSAYGGPAGVAADGSGQVVVAWLGFTPTPTGLYLRRSLDGGTTWSDRQLVSPGVTGAPGYDDDAGPQVAHGPGGQVYLAFIQPDAAGQVRLWFSRSVDGGATFSGAVPVSDGSAPAGNAALAVGPSGTVHVVWEEGRLASGAAVAIRYSRSLDAGAAFQPALVLSADLPSVGVRGPQVVEPAGGVVVVAFRNDPTTSASDIVLRTSRDGGASFGGPETANDVPASRTTFPALAGAPGRVFVAWVDGGRGALRLRRGALTAPPPGPEVVFADVPAEYWARPWVEALFHAGVTGGCSASPFNFCPDAPVSREQIAVFLVRAASGPDVAPAPCAAPVFADVPCGSPYAPWIEELVRRGVTAGCGAGAYCPGAPATRQEMAVFLLRAVEGPGFAPTGCTGQFADVPCGTPYAPWIEELVRRGVTAGCGAGVYCPAAAVSRAQMAVFLVKAFGLAP